MPGGVDHPSVDIELVLSGRRVCSPNRQAAAITGYACDLALTMARSSVERVKDLHLGEAEPACDLQPAQKCLCLLGAARGHEGSRPDSGIARPGEAVIPVKPA